jgi:hypothetical protein
LDFFRYVGLKSLKFWLLRIVRFVHLRRSRRDRSLFRSSFGSSFAFQSSLFRFGCFCTPPVSGRLGFAICDGKKSLASASFRES